MSLTYAAEYLLGPMPGVIRASITGLEGAVKDPYFVYGQTAQGLEDWLVRFFSVRHRRAALAEYQDRRERELLSMGI